MDQGLLQAAKTFVEQKFGVKISDSAVKICARYAEGIVANLEKNGKTSPEHALLHPDIHAQVKYAAKMSKAEYEASNKSATIA